MLTRRQFLVRSVEAGLALSLGGSGMYGLLALSVPYPTSLLASPKQLGERLNRGVRVVDARPPLKFHRGHIPGAVNVWDGDINVWTGGIPRQIAPLSRLGEVFGRAGIALNTEVIVYDGGGEPWAPRLLFALEYAGHTDVKLLDGGLRAWERAGGPLTLEESAYSEKEFIPSPKEALVEASWLIEHRDDPSVKIVDARSFEEYAQGHIPGASLVSSEALLRPDGRFLRAHALKLQFEKAGIRRDHPRTVIAYSHTGLRAAVVYVALRLMGHPHVKLYDGGWAEWLTLGVPIAKLSEEEIAKGKEHRSTCW